jgi:hypothetical protein
MTAGVPARRRRDHNDVRGLGSIDRPHAVCENVQLERLDFNSGLTGGVGASIMSPVSSLNRRMGTAYRGTSGVTDRTLDL